MYHKNHIQAKKSLTVELMCITWEYRSMFINFSTFTEPGLETCQVVVVIRKHPILQQKNGKNIHFFPKERAARSVAPTIQQKKKYKSKETKRKWHVLCQNEMQ